MVCDLSDWALLILLSARQKLNRCRYLLERYSFRCDWISNWFRLSILSPLISLFLHIWTRFSPVLFRYRDHHHPNFTHSFFYIDFTVYTRVSSFKFEPQFRCCEFDWTQQPNAADTARYSSMKLLMYDKCHCRGLRKIFPIFIQ